MPGQYFTYILVDGFDAPESWGGVWSMTKNPRLKIWVTQAFLKKDMVITFDLVPYSPNNLNQIIEIKLNQHFVKRVIFNERELIKLVIPAYTLSNPAIDINIKIQTPQRPIDFIKHNGDTRALGIGLIRLQVKSF
jgi:hypothetical protein